MTVDRDNPFLTKEDFTRDMLDAEAWQKAKAAKDPVARARELTKDERAKLDEALAAEAAAAAVRDALLAARRAADKAALGAQTEPSKWTALGTIVRKKVDREAPKAAARAAHESFVDAEDHLLVARRRRLRLEASINAARQSRAAAVSRKQDDEAYAARKSAKKAAAK